MVGVAVKVTEVPVQMVVVGTAIRTDGVTGAVTIIAIALDVPVVGIAQAVLEVKITLTRSPFTKEVVV